MNAKLEGIGWLVSLWNRRTSAITKNRDGDEHCACRMRADVLAERIEELSEENRQLQYSLIST
jgi:hypothetical protein